MLPFLTIMLGLMSVMALTTMSISVQKRQEAKQQQLVKLVGVPSGFRPFHVRCSGQRILWLEGDGTWRETSIFSLLGMMRMSEGMPQLHADSLRLLTFLRQKAEQNGRLSFSNEQNTMILWVEPDGTESAQILQYLIGDLGLPLRIGKLPIFKGEEIRYHATLSE